MRPHVPHVPERSAGTPGAPVTCSVPLPLKGSGRNAEHAPTRHAHASGGARGRNTPAPGHTEALPETGAATVSLEAGELVVRIRLDAQPVDELVAVAAEPLGALGLELRAVQGLIAEGKLRAVHIGRRRFTKRSYLLALVDELEAERPEAHRDAEPVDVLTLAARKAARRASARKAEGQRGRAA